jgi:hypothetical protein
MGLDYSYEIVCTEAQLWDVLDDAAELSTRDFHTYKVNTELEDCEVELDYSAIVGTRPVIYGEPAKALDFSTSKWFVMDEALQSFWMTKKNIGRRVCRTNPGNGRWMSKGVSHRMLLCSCLLR